MIKGMAHINAYLDDYAFFLDALLVVLTDDIQGLPACLDKPGMNHVNAWVCQGVK